ncbi:iron complex outermembrane receptor protein [Silvimonas terrae]|uniref:Iron complex outermembrane receptor protein n=1 Tax=Silvimonas terrae TaxID=300266 RepID=A0A840REZ7_9NEIS|nr:TonB-dependent receptor [Silvimonas terrae]MBB5191587.1 iron complex outermembrane receptor protein [Silvimonas terrae]
MQKSRTAGCAFRLSAITVALLAASQTSFADDPATDLGQVTVTGSRIPRAQKEGPTSVTVITGEQLEQEGYRNVFDALNQQTQNTGFTQGADYGNTFTPAANAINLRGLGPNHTLVLINGRRVADYPVAYDGTVNFVNLANIPSALVDRIEILNAGASAIYGSDAIAGVVNIILKHHADGVDVNVKAGSTSRGGGDNGRVQISGGKDFGDLSTVFGLEISKTRSIAAQDRDFMSSSTLEGETPTKTWSRLDATTGQYLDGSTACGNLSGLFGGTNVPVNSKSGVYCGSGKAQPDYWTVQTANQSENLYGGFDYRLTDSTTLFGNVMLGWNHTTNNTRGPSWTSLGATSGYFLNQNTGDYESWTRRFAPEEIGGTSAFDKDWHDTAGNITVGVRGSLFDTGWNYEAAYNASGYKSVADVPRLYAGIDSYFLGPQLGTDSDGIPIYAPDASRFAQPLTASQFASLYGQTESTNTSWTQTASFSANGKLFDLPAGPVKSAGLLEWGSQGFTNKPDARINEGVFYNLSGADPASGNRTRYAAALELNIPIVKSLDATLAGRYDDYSFAGQSDSKLTWNAALEYRPLKELLVRGNYATSFRAPDMNYIFQSPTKGYYASTTDYYRCNAAGQTLGNCDYANVSPGANYVQTGNKDLKPENGRSWGLGFVWSPTSSFDVSADYWHIRIDDEVTNIDADALLRTESDCRLGLKDINSSQCQDAISRVIRNPDNAVLDPGAINTILVNPINAAMEETAGYDLTGKYRWRAGAVGNFLLTATYTKVLVHKSQQFKGDEVEDLTKAMDNYDWPDKFMTSLTWNRGDWTSTVQVERYGKIPNQAGTGYLTPTALANWSLGYQVSKNASLSLIVNNVFNTIKEDDSAGWPYYAVGSYSPIGREGWLAFNYHFD